MEQAEDQSSSGSSSSSSTAGSGGNTRPAQISQMSLYERQAVQALQALQRQPNAAQYFQQLMLQQQINNAQLHNLAAVQQATLAASRQSSSPNTSVPAVSTAQCTGNLSSTSGGGTMTNPRPVGPATSVTSSALSQSVLLGGNSAAQGQMYLRVNRSLRAPQLIFMPGGTATAAVATVAQQQPQQQQQQQQPQQQQQQEVPPTSSSNQSDSDQVQNLALRCASAPRAAAIKSEYPDRKDPSSFALGPQSQQQQAFSPSSQQISGSKLPAPPSSTSSSLSSSSTSSSPSLPLSQLLLSPSRLTPAATVTHILVPSSNVPTSSPGFPKPSMAAQTLVVQPLQQQQNGGDKMPGPVPIQPKTAQSGRPPSQMPPRHPPPILPAPPTPHPPHVPVQLLGPRQGPLGNSQAVAAAQARTCYSQQDGSTHNPNHSSASTAVTMVTAMETGTAGAGVKLTNQNAEPSQLGSSAASQTTDGDHSNSVAPPAGETVFEQTATTQVKPAIGSLKRKSESDVAGEMTSETAAQNCPSVPDSAPPLSPAPSSDTAPEIAFSTPPTLSVSLPHPRAPLPQAVVKPQVLTHLIEGFVIQEGAEPFPVTGPIKERAEGVPVPLSMQPENSAPAVLKCEFCESFAPASQFRGTKRFCSKTCAKRYNVSCSHHFRTSRGRSSAPGYEEMARRRGPHRSSSEIACAKITGRHLPVKCRSESSRSEDVSSCEGEEEEEEEEDYLSPGSSFSCSRPAHCGPQLDESAQGGLPLDGDHFLSASPAHWSVEEVCRFISSLQ
ncbi:polyhomeotic-like protein 1, partial [Clarias magur]